MQPNRVRHGRRVLVAAFVVMCATLAACSSSSGSKASSSASSHDVQIHLIAFRPATLHIGVGDSVTWHQTDPGVHTVTSGTVEQIAGGVTPKPDGRFASGELAT